MTVPAHDRVEVRFPAAAQMAGTARFQVAAVSGCLCRRRHGRAAGVHAGHHRGLRHLRGDRLRALRPSRWPRRRDVFTQFGGLEITTSSTALQALTDAVLYLVAYPYECSEQLASRILAVAALRDVLTAFKAAGPALPGRAGGGRRSAT